MRRVSNMLWKVPRKHTKKHYFLYYLKFLVTNFFVIIFSFFPPGFGPWDSWAESESADRYSIPLPYFYVLLQCTITLSSVWTFFVKNFCILKGSSNFCKPRHAIGSYLEIEIFRKIFAGVVNLVENEFIENRIIVAAVSVR